MQWVCMGDIISLFTNCRIQPTVVRLLLKKRNFFFDHSQSSPGKMLTLGVVKDTLEPDTPFLLSQLSRVDNVLLGKIIGKEYAMNDKQNFTFDHLTTHHCHA